MENTTTMDSASQVYSEVPGLIQRHFEELATGSGISVEVIKERGYKTMWGAKELQNLGFAKYQRKTPGIYMPVWTTDGKNSLCQYKPDIPRQNRKGKDVKYETPDDIGLRIDCPPRCRENLNNPNTRLWVTEGIKKGDALASRGETVIDLLGVWGFKHKNEFKAPTISVDLNCIAWTERTVLIVYDSDIMTKPGVRRALEELTEVLSRKGAKVFHVYLPSPNGKKVGVDDYLLNHSIEELLSHAVQPDDISRIKEETGNIYSFDGMGNLCRSKFTKEGLIKIRVCNFDARIVEEVILDNGVETSHSYKIEGSKKDGPLGFVEIPASSFSGMNWVHRFGYDAIIEPGANVKDYVRHYIQTQSTPKRVTTYTHTGWRKIDNEWIYLFSGGAIGQEDISVFLPLELKRYFLPQRLEHELESIKASLQFLEIGKRKILLPLFTYLYLAPLTTLFSPLPNFSLYLYGETGVFKTTLSILMLCHFGRFESIESLSNFEDTGNALGKRAFTLKDTLMVVDDYHPSSQRFLAQQKEALAQRLIREFANRTERGRLNADTTEKPRYAPRGMLLITGEELVSLQSTLARVLVVEIGNGDIDKDKLTELQLKAQLLSEAMSSYLQWLIGQGIHNIQSRFKEKFPKYRSEALKGSIHPKLSEQVAFLQFSLSNVLDWLLDKKAISEGTAKELIKEGWEISNELIDENQKRIHNEDPVTKFKDILRSLIIQKKVRIEDREDPMRSLSLGGEEGKADLIGFYDDRFFYLLPTPLWNAVQKYCASSNDYFPVVKNTLYSMLEKKRLIGSREGRHTIPLKHNGQVHKVLKISRQGLWEKEVTESTYADNDI